MSKFCVFLGGSVLINFQLEKYILFKEKKDVSNFFLQY